MGLWHERWAAGGMSDGQLVGLWHERCGMGDGALGGRAQLVGLWHERPMGLWHERPRRLRVGVRVQGWIEGEGSVWGTRGLWQRPQPLLLERGVKWGGTARMQHKVCGRRRALHLQVLPVLQTGDGCRRVCARPRRRGSGCGSGTEARAGSAPHGGVHQGARASPLAMPAACAPTAAAPACWCCALAAVIQSHGTHAATLLRARGPTWPTDAYQALSQPLLSATHLCPAPCSSIPGICATPSNTAPSPTPTAGSRSSCSCRLRRTCFRRRSCGSTCIQAPPSHGQRLHKL